MGRGGPGRGRSQRADGIVKTNHQNPIKKRTRRRENVDDFRLNRIITDTIWTKRAAKWLIPIPRLDI